MTLLPAASLAVEPFPCTPAASRAAYDEEIDQLIDEAMAEVLAAQEAEQALAAAAAAAALSPAAAVLVQPVSSVTVPDSIGVDRPAHVQTSLQQAAGIPVAHRLIYSLQTTPEAVLYELIFPCGGRAGIPVPTPVAMPQ